jgi:hypothetical protein
MIQRQRRENRGVLGGGSKEGGGVDEGEVVGKIVKWGKRHGKRSRQ